MYKNVYNKNKNNININIYSKIFKQLMKDCDLNRTSQSFTT